MFTLQYGEKGEILLKGRWDASQFDKAAAFFKDVTDSRIINCRDLEYISSSGLGILLMAQKRLNSNRNGLVLTNLTSYIHDIFRYSGMDQIFEIQDS